MTAAARAILARGSRSFALAGRLLGTLERDRAAVVYAYCRRADDAVDLAPRGERRAALARLGRELEAVYRGPYAGDPLLDAFGEVTRACAIPRDYPAELLAGLAMDTEGQRYRTLDELLLYCYRVAGTVGLMMCHVLGLHDDRALPRAVHLGIAMQLTNICRDVAEDWEAGRLYLPDDLLRDEGAPQLASSLGGPMPVAARGAVARVARRLLEEADRYYASGDRGLIDLPWRAALAIRTARLVYAAIGEEIAARRFDVLRGRAVVGGGRKAALAARAAARALAEAPLRARARGRVRPPGRHLPFGEAAVRIRP